MHDTSRCTGCLPAQNFSGRLSRERRKQFATLPKKAPQVLVQDTIYLSSPAVVWPHRALESRRIFQELLQRYYRQIVYGCTNKRCEISTCLSYQRRVSKKPFRKFTVLSARTLASFLATQDNPEKGLCPYEPVALVEDPETELFRDMLSKSQHEKNTSEVSKPASPRISSEPTSGNRGSGNQNPTASSSSEDEKLNPTAKSNSEDGNMDKNLNENKNTFEDSRKEKDPKSFTQNLFDTEAMKILQVVKIKEGLLHWAPWFKQPENNTSTAESIDGPMPISGNVSSVIEETDESYSSDQDKSVFSTVQSRNSTAENPKCVAPLLSQWLEAKSDANATFQLSQGNHTNALTILEATSIVSRPSSILPTMKGPNSLERSIDHHIKNQVQDPNFKSLLAIPATQTLSNQNSREKIFPVQDPELVTMVNGDFERITSYLSSEACMKAPANPNLDPVEPPQALRRFTFENVSALVTIIKMVDPGLRDEHCFVQSLGRTTTSFGLSKFICGTVTRQEMSIAFGTQSIIYVLSTTDALLTSFKGPDHVVSSKLKQSVKLAEIVRAFRMLMEIDYHPRNIFPSLWISTGNLHPPIVVRSKTALLKTCRSTRLDRPPFNTSFDSQFQNADFLGDSDAAHVVKISLAALVASIPECDPDTWSRVRKIRASGRVSPSPHGSQNEKGFVNSVLEVMDAFDDEMALRLMMRIVRAISARQCVSEISKYQGICMKKDGENMNHGENFMDILLREIIGSGTVETISNQPNTTDRGFGDMLMAAVANIEDEPQKSADTRSFHLSVIVEWLRSVILSEWDGKAEISRWGAVGGALEFMSHIYRIPSPLGVSPELFHTPFLSERLDVMDMPTEWLSSQRDRNTVHLLSYPFLFMPSALVSYFRAINHAAMFKAFENSMVAAKLAEQMSFSDQFTGRGELQLHDRLKTAMNNYLVLEIGRQDVLTDALNQLWRRERRELMRPLKVRMGMDEGEEGIDHGGVQQEFFRVAMSEALRLDYGLFVTDDITRISWFQPCSLEPLYKFELLGLLTSLAVYNGLTLPVTFPLALYRKLLGLPVTRIAHIIDGWPSLAKGLETLLSWTDGDVEDVFLRSYMFSVEALGETISVDIEKFGREDDWPPVQGSILKGRSTASPNDPGNMARQRAEMLWKAPKGSSNGSDEWIARKIPASPSPTISSQSSSRPRSGSILSQSAMVNNSNREQYVQDYIFWLTDKSIRPQYEAFARGFYICLDRKAATIFTAEALKRVVEGIQEIDVNALQETTRYEGGYSAEHGVIKDFWHIVHQFPPTQLRQLLEFVTASDRIPVNGVRSILFVIQKNGVEDERLPTSLTCFGRLLLPEYSSRQKLKEKLCAAIENSKGFGVA